MVWSTQVGAVDNATTRWAIQWRGSRSTATANWSSSTPLAVGPMINPLPPDPSTRLNTNSPLSASDAARPRRVEDTGTDNQRLGTELQGVEVLVVDAPIDHVHRDLALGGAQEHL